jgi:hypothetical protein
MLHGYGEVGCLPWGRFHRRDPSRRGRASRRHAQYQSKPVAHVSRGPLQIIVFQRTLCVILGPLAASVVCAKNIKVIDKINSAEMTIL